MFLLDGKVIQPGTTFTDSKGVTYPPQWLYQTTLAQKNAIGITEVPDPVRADDRFYWDGDINNPKDLKELKEYHTKQIKVTAGQLLAQTDWLVVRKFERGIDIPTTVVDKRADIIAEENRLSLDIEKVKDVAGLITVLNNQNWNE